MTAIRKCTCKTEIHAKGGPDDCTSCRKRKREADILKARRDFIRRQKAAQRLDMKRRGVTETRVKFIDWRNA